MSTKQVICIRRDLKIRRGKEAAQCGHAAEAFITRKTNIHFVGGESIAHIDLTDEEVEWIRDGHTKVVCQVANETELLEVVEKAKAAGLTVHLITDLGKTEFKGVPTHTCVAIGPHHSEKFVGVTDNLALY